MPKPTQRSFSHSFFVYTTKLQTFLWTTARVVLCHQDSSWGAVSGSRLLAVLADVQVLWVSFLQIEEGGGWGGFNRSGGRLPARRCTSWCPCWVSGVPGGWWDRGTGRGSPPLWALSLASGRKSGTCCLLRVVACESLLQIWTRERVGKRT